MVGRDTIAAYRREAARLMTFSATKWRWAWVGGLATLGFSACDRRAEPPPPSRPFAGVEVVVAAVDEPALGGLVAPQRGEWGESRGGVLQLREGALAADAAASQADVLIFPGDLLGGLVDADALAPIADDLMKPPPPPAPGESRPPDTFEAAGILPPYRDRVARYGRDRLALPLGTSIPVLVYRKDYLARPEVVAAAEQAGVPLGPPETWEQLDALATFLHGRDWDGDGAADAGLAVPLGADPEGVGTAIVLARAAALGQHRDHFSFLYDAETMDPRVASPPFVEALEGVAGWRAAGPDGVAGFDATAARTAFRAGKAALLIDRAEHATDWVDPRVTASVGVAPLPGSRRVFEPARKEWETDGSPPNRPSYLPIGGGWLVGVSRRAEGTVRAAALDFALYLASSETAGRLFGNRDRPLLPVRSNLLGRGLPDPARAKGVDGRQWSDAIQKTILAPTVVVGHRIPGARADLADLEAARLAVLNGESAEAALGKTAEAWARRTDEYGRERRRWHYRRSLNTLTTAPEPPPFAAAR